MTFNALTDSTKPHLCYYGKYMRYSHIYYSACNATRNNAPHVFHFRVTRVSNLLLADIVNAFNPSDLKLWLSCFELHTIAALMYKMSVRLNSGFANILLVLAILFILTYFFVFCPFQTLKQANK